VVVPTKTFDPKPEYTHHRCQLILSQSYGKLTHKSSKITQIIITKICVICVIFDK
jgi:hypothetical protein